MVFYMISILRPQCNDRNYTVLACSSSDLNELNTSWLDFNHGSIAKIIGSDSYFILDKSSTTPEWILVS